MNPKKILIIEDESDILKVLRMRFQQDGWEVFTAEDGTVGKKLALEKDISVVLLDLILPEENGFDVLEFMRKEPKLKNVPVIVVSNIGGDEDIEKAMGMGANAYFVKTKHRIVDIIERAQSYL